MENICVTRKPLIHVSKKENVATALLVAFKLYNDYNLILIEVIRHVKRKKCERIGNSDI